MLFCNSCKEKKSIQLFHKNKCSKTGYQSRCKECDKEWHRLRYLKDKEKILAQSKLWRVKNKEVTYKKSAEWRENNKDKVKVYQRKTNLRKKFGIEIEDYEFMYKAQNGECAICNKQFKKAGHDGLVIDHCHKSNKIRKLLCSSCNKGIGHFFDSPEFLRNAANYIEAHI